MYSQTHACEKLLLLSIQKSMKLIGAHVEVGEKITSSHTSVCTVPVKTLVGKSNQPCAQIKIASGIVTWVTPP